MEHVQSNVEACRCQHFRCFVYSGACHIKLPESVDLLKRFFMIPERILTYVRLPTDGEGWVVDTTPWSWGQYATKDACSRSSMLHRLDCR